MDDKLEDGLIEIDSDRGKIFGFTSDRFDGYLWKKGGSVYISFIVSRERGNFRQLVSNIQAHGFMVKIPTPLGRMQRIVRVAGYTRCDELTEDGEGVEVWRCPATAPNTNG